MATAALRPTPFAVPPPPNCNRDQDPSEVPAFGHHYINGQWVAALDPNKCLEVVDSNTGRVCAWVPDGTPEEIDRAVAAARAAFLGWSRQPLQERKAAMQRILESWQSKRELAVEWLQKELGCPGKFAREVQTQAVDQHFRTAMEVIDSVCFEEKTGKRALILKEPVGVVGCVTPWNYPLNQIAAKICPAMLVGCTVVLKPSSNTPINAYLLAQAVQEAGLPPGVFNMVQGKGSVCGQRLAEHPDVDLLSFTGSTTVARRLLQAAADSNMKQVRTELGGKGAALLLGGDVDYEQVVPQFVRQLMANSGQTCGAPSRMLVPRDLYDRVILVAKETVESERVGRADDPHATMGPLVSAPVWERVQDYIQKSMHQGCRLVTGGIGKPEGVRHGFFAKPTILADVSNEMPVAHAEIFGPVLSMLPYDSEEEGIKLANDTRYSLSSAVASRDVPWAMRVAKRLRSATVSVNGVDFENFGQVAPDPPCGDAREWGKLGVEEFLHTKTVVEKCFTGGCT